MRLSDNALCQFACMHLFVSFLFVLASFVGSFVTQVRFVFWLGSSQLSHLLLGQLR